MSQNFPQYYGELAVMRFRVEQAKHSLREQVNRLPQLPPNDPLFEEYLGALSAAAAADESLQQSINRLNGSLFAVARRVLLQPDLNEGGSHG